MTQKPEISTPPATTAQDGAQGMSPSRRRWLMTGVAAAAALGGAGVAWQRFQPHAIEPGVEAALWDLTLKTPTGDALAMQSFRGKPLLLNFWATWCPPCVEELPLLNEFYAEQSARGWQVIGLAVDQVAAVNRFLNRIPLVFPVGMAGIEGTDLGRTLGNLTGGLPFTVVFGADGLVQHRKMGQLSASDLQQWAGA